jgi:hypothetical protein
MRLSTGAIVTAPRLERVAEDIRLFGRLPGDERETELTYRLTDREREEVARHISELAAELLAELTEEMERRYGGGIDV